jgi:predicted metalloprotease with PDZ domain
MPIVTGRFRLTLASLALSVAASIASAATPPPQDVPYPGLLTLAVDATDLDHRLFTVHETIPVVPGPSTLLFPRWLPGDHGPYGQPSRLAGLVIRAGQQRLAWQRDPLDPLAYRVDVPAGVHQLDLDFQHVNPLRDNGDRVTMTRTLLGVEWEAVLLYPAGYYASRIPVQARLRLPPDWKAATALRDEADHLVVPDAQGWWQFGTASLERLVDSPIVAGRHFKRVELDPPGTPRPVALDLFADSDAGLEFTSAQMDAHRRLVRQADLLFASRHFRHYDLLFSLSEEFGGIGLEHQESSEDGVWPTYFQDWDKAIQERELLPHEYAHSWNGKFRRPADLWTPNYNEPMQNSLLWVYEGQTEYWGQVLAARSGLIDDTQAHDEWAAQAAAAEHRAGRQWRPLQDTTNEATLADEGARDWRSWQRREDYYAEGALIWLDVDMLIRQQSRGQRSLDDFAKRFFSVDDGRVDPLTYRFDDVVETLNQVQPFDWAGFLRRRLDSVDAPSPLEGLARSGWRLVYRETESADARNATRHGEKTSDFSYSLGLSIAEKDAHVSDVAWHGPAFEAGLAGGVKLLAVNMQDYKPERLAQAITANKDGQHPIELLVKDGDRYRVVRIDYRGGLRYPALERIPGQPDLLAALLKPR